MTEYGRIHTDGSRSGGQPMMDILERLRTKYCCTTENCNCEEAAAEIETLRHDLERQMTIANEHVNEVERLREALRNIQIEAEREKGSWVHLKRVIALNCKTALEQSK